MSPYATRSTLGPYHLVEARGGLTLCGLKVSKIQRKELRGTLTLVKEKPEVGHLCKHCSRLAIQDPKPSTLPQKGRLN